MSALDNIVSILDPSGKLAAEVSKPRTGFVGAIAAKDLPEGWVSVTYWWGHRDDQTTEYTGPVLHESERSILLEVFGEPLALLKAYTTITRPEVPA